MKINCEKEIIKIIKEDEWMMEILKVAKALKLPDWWICAGFVRSKIWDTIHGFENRTPIPDIDVIYFDCTTVEESIEKSLEKQLIDWMPNIPWSVKNQARMHVINNLPSYTSSVDGIANFPETATALGVKLDEENNVLLSAPHGINDVTKLVIKPTPRFETTKELVTIYEDRILKKNWSSIWPMISINNARSD
ncbi:hypothetical protein PB01_07075 [Psychrobacillus glaciei]|uniref:Nucleotidyltransferase family protein n=1 Tax=Psychrobacillus glaciei TaxID=2283160 RepID=A0A5J6SLN5_9BACI|nr:nucleotidyltransferase family protein [Psychrobacillus glaciei]QFF98612.1 hypothetical protein PB01_07075 [Psychrobacillus glaciei]